MKKPPSTIDIAPFSKAVASLEEAIAQPYTAFMRDSVIQRFEYTYELAWKALKRFLEKSEGTAHIEPLSRKELFRLGAEKGFIADPSAWFAFHDARNRTSHTYNETTADEVYAKALLFPAAARALIGKIKRRNHD